MLLAFCASLTHFNLLLNRRQMMPPIPDTCFFTIPDIYTRDYLDRERLLLYDSHDSKFHLELSSYVHLDGAFSTALPNFNQVYIIQAIHHGTCKIVLPD